MTRQELFDARYFLKKWANPGLFFVYFRYFLDTISIIQIEKSVDGVLGIRTGAQIKPRSYGGHPLVARYFI